MIQAKSCVAILICGYALLLFSSSVDAAYPMAKPTGVVFDIRTYSSSQWKINQSAVFDQMLSLYRGLTSRWLGLHIPVRYSLVLPSFLNDMKLYSRTENGVNKTYSEWAMDAVAPISDASIPVLNFRSTAAGLIDNGISPCEYAAQSNMECEFLVETANNTSPDFTFAGTGLPYFENTLATVSESMLNAIGDKWHYFTVHDSIGLGLMARFSGNIPFKSPNQEIHLLISDPYFLYHPEQNISALFDTIHYVGWCCRLNVTKVVIESSIYLQENSTILQDFINLSNSKSLSVDLYFANSSWGFTKNHEAVYQLLTDTAMFISKPNVSPSSEPSGTSSSSSPPSSSSSPPSSSSSPPSNAPPNNVPTETTGSGVTAAPTVNGPTITSTTETPTPSNNNNFNHDNHNNGTSVTNTSISSRVVFPFATAFIAVVLPIFFATMIALV